MKTMKLRPKLTSRTSDSELERNNTEVRPYCKVSFLCKQQSPEQGALKEIFEEISAQIAPYVQSQEDLDIRKHPEIVN